MNMKRVSFGQWNLLLVALLLSIGMVLNACDDTEDSGSGNDQEQNDDEQANNDDETPDVEAPDDEEPDDETPDDEEPDDETPDDEEPTVSNDISVLKDLFYTDDVTFVINDNTITLTTKALPDHKSMYYATTDPLYEAYDEPDNSDFKKNPGEIEAQDLVFTIPRFPEEATNKEATSLGPMGVAINSVVFFNQNAAPGDDIFDELNTFDQYEGHPAGATYHYHIDPVWLTSSDDNPDADPERFVGLLMDGFPVYGPHEDNAALTNDDLDDYHGHFGVTEEFPEGIYHYHITEEYPWINGDGYYGEAGSLAR